MPYALVPSQEMHGLFQEALEAQAAGRGYNMARNLLGRVGLGDGGAASARRDLNDPSSHGCLRWVALVQFPAVHAASCH